MVEEKRGKNIKNKFTNLYAFIILLVIMILSSVFMVVHPIASSPDGEAAGYIICEIFRNLYIPSVVAMITIAAGLIIKFIYLNIKSDTKMDKSTGSSGKNIFILLAVVLIIFCFSFKNIKNIGNLIMDIPCVVEANYSTTEGVVKFYEDRHESLVNHYMNVNGIMFSGGYSYGEKLYEGSKYNVQYLPHSKYVVNFKRMAWFKVNNSGPFFP